MAGKHPTCKIKSDGPLCLQDHEYYGPLIDLYSEHILKSGLLLDEDLEVLLNISNFGTLPLRYSYKPSFNLLASVFSVLSCSLLAMRYRVPWLVVPSVILTVKCVITELKSFSRRKNDREIVDNLIEVINRTRKLNLSIIRYMKTRTELESTRNSFLTLHNTSVKEFMHFLLKKEKEFFQYMENILQAISLHSSELFDDYKCLKCVNPSSLLETYDIDNTENCLALTRKIEDLHVLFASKLLSYIGIVCCSKSSCLHAHDLDKLSNETLYNAEKYFQQHHDIVKKEFVTLRRSVNRKSEYTLQSTGKPCGNKQIQTKLKETLLCAVTNLSVILEKSQGMLDAVENGDENNLNDISDAIIDLRKHTFATYETLDVLCKLYGILSNSNATNPTENKVPSLKRQKHDLEENQAVINCDDSSEPLEENFELYVGDEEVEPENSSTKCDYVHSEEYLTLMLRELRQSLKQHQRFIDAKNRRGSDEDEDIIRKSSVELRKSPPKFDLNVLNPQSSQACEQTSSVTLNAAAPPPPPLPAFHLGDLEEECGQVNARSMLDNIKALSGQRNIQEDVFGD